MCEVATENKHYVLTLTTDNYHFWLYWTRLFNVNVMSQLKPYFIIVVHHCFGSLSINYILLSFTSCPVCRWCAVPFLCHMQCGMFFQNNSTLILWTHKTLSQWCWVVSRCSLSNFRHIVMFVFPHETMQYDLCTVDSSTVHFRSCDEVFFSASSYVIHSFKLKLQPGFSFLS